MMFVEGRNILDGPLMVNELCSWAKKTRMQMLLFKFDFKKAFDSINWEYLDFILEKMGTVRSGDYRSRAAYTPPMPLF